MTDGMELSQVNEVNPEKTEVAEAQISLDRAAFEPEAVLEKVSDIKLSEDLEKAIVAAVDAVQGTPAVELPPEITDKIVITAPEGRTNTGTSGRADSLKIDTVPLPERPAAGSREADGREAIGTWPTPEVPALETVQGYPEAIIYSNDRTSRIADPVKIIDSNDGSDLPAGADLPGGGDQSGPADHERGSSSSSALPSPGADETSNPPSDGRVGEHPVSEPHSENEYTLTQQVSTTIANTDHLSSAGENDSTTVPSETSENAYDQNSADSAFADAVKEFEKGADEDSESPNRVIRQTAAEPLGLDNHSETSTIPGGSVVSDAHDAISDAQDASTDLQNSSGDGEPAGSDDMGAGEPDDSSDDFSGLPREPALDDFPDTDEGKGAFDSAMDEYNALVAEAQSEEAVDNSQSNRIEADQYEEASMLRDELSDWPDGEIREITIATWEEGEDGTYVKVEKTVTLTREDAENLLDHMEDLLNELDSRVGAEGTESPFQVAEGSLLVGEVLGAELAPDGSELLGDLEIERGDTPSESSTQDEGISPYVQLLEQAKMLDEEINRLYGFGSNWREGEIREITYTTLKKTGEHSYDPKVVTASVTADELDEIVRELQRLKDTILHEAQYLNRPYDPGSAEDNIAGSKLSEISNYEENSSDNSGFSVQISTTETPIPDD